jgi:DNA (cytosine-5)-methyltransferase 1
MKHGSLFSGIGGFDLAAEWMGWTNIFHCEWNAFGQKVLKYYWPNAISYQDITKTDFSIHRGRIDILTGGFPCQPYSMAGKRLGKEDKRHLWPEMLRAIREIQPRWVVGENVLGLVNWSRGLVFHEVQADLEAEGYEIQPFVLPACAVNAPHRRDRVWFVAYNHNFGCKRFSEQTSDRTNSEEQIRDNKFCKEQGWNEVRSINKRDSEDSGTSPHPNGNGLNQRNGNDEEQPSEGRFNALSHINESNGNGNASDSSGIGQECGKERKRSQGRSQSNDQLTKRRNKLPGADFQMFPTVPPICTRNDGLSDRLDGITFYKWRNESIKAGGNAIVPQVVYNIFNSIELYENVQNKKLQPIKS